MHLNVPKTTATEFLTLRKTSQQTLSSLQLKPPVKTDRILLHCCCAPCSSAMVECLLENNIRPTLYFYNPNIHPQREYLIRKDECVRFMTDLGLDFVDADYDPARWFDITKGMGHLPERGERCTQCFDMRLLATADYAAAHDFTVIATTLAASRWKNLEQVNGAGARAVASYPEVIFWNQNWRKGGLSERRNAINREYDFYLQNYCGCVYSLRDVRLYQQKKAAALAAGEQPPIFQGCGQCQRHAEKLGMTK